MLQKLAADQVTAPRSPSAFLELPALELSKANAGANPIPVVARTTVALRPQIVILW